MKNKSAFYSVLLSVLFLSILFSCKKEAIKTAPTVSNTAATNITATTASAGGDIVSDGGATITAKGICWSTNQSPTTSDSKTTNGTGTGGFSGSMTGLTPGATYNVRAYATNSVGTGYSSQTSFTTLALLPVLTTTDPTSVTSVSASSGGNITNDGGSSITARGVCWGSAQNPTTANSKTTDGTGSASFTSAITGLTPGTTYYVRAYATNSIGTAYGNQVTAITTATISTVTTTAISAITSNTATSGGNITSDGGAAVTTRGVCWSVSTNPTISNSKTTDGTGVGSFTSSLSGLAANTTYFLRAYATNSAGTSYGNETSFKTSITVIDIDGNVYNTVIIGNQVWMVENLKTTKYRDGTSIQNVADNSTWAKLYYEGAFCWYNNDATSNKNTYGALYNWGAVASNHNIAPMGWHVPTEAEWTTLITFLGGEIIAGGKLKEVGVIHWSGSNPNATNSSGFTALPGGYRFAPLYSFGEIGNVGNWWSSTRSDVGLDYAWYHSISSNYLSITTKSSAPINTFGCSIRCLKD